MVRASLTITPSPYTSPIAGRLGAMMAAAMIVRVAEARTTARAVRVGAVRVVTLLGWGSGGGVRVGGRYVDRVGT
ncbi:hypothetical protein GCM10011609_22410 [Lentzea pudingi]|uniref:Uncharacterized protein n=1 Tax=Lentzea pudingi TaxID=1789439 RepID=A0ABQ2HNX4_9PSEU|nr:hypothetical protein GCM10011609_22410 [Lentzea pudingi]